MVLKDGRPCKKLLVTRRPSLYVPLLAAYFCSAGSTSDRSSLKRLQPHASFVDSSIELYDRRVYRLHMLNIV
jgi:hypothetical protein